MSLEAEFEQRLRDSIRDSIALGYNPTRSSEMLSTWAKRLVATGDIQDGIKKIVAMGHPELSMESIMIEPKFAALFTAGEVDAARWRLSLAVGRTE
jgi:hypothetical protein